MVQMLISPMALLGHHRVLHFLFSDLISSVYLKEEGRLMTTLLIRGACVSKIDLSVPLYKLTRSDKFSFDGSLIRREFSGSRYEIFRLSRGGFAKERERGVDSKMI